VTRKAYTTEIRVLLCQACGAPLAAAPQGGAIACSYCHAQNHIGQRRNDSVAMSAPQSTLDEGQRVARLRMQDGRPLVPPMSLMPLLGNGGFHPAKVEEAFHIYRATRNEVLATHSPEAAERLYFLTLIANTHLTQIGNDEQRRAILETTLDTLSLPRHVQVVRCLLASASAKEGDIASAENWLAPCNPRSEDIDSDSAFRVARAFVDTTRGDFNAVIQNLGPIDDGYPIADAWDPTCAVLRANALERLGDLGAAVTSLRSRMSKENQSGRATMEAIIAAHPQLALCPQSFAMATQGHAQVAAQAMSSNTGAGIGSIFYYVGIAICVFGVLLTLGLALPMIIGGVAAGEPGVGFGSGLFSGFMALVTTVPLGAIFALVGRMLRVKGQRAAWLRLHGVPAQGRVRTMQQTGMRINNVPVVRVEVEVQHPQVPPYVASFEQLFNSSLAVALVPGAVVPLRVHPQQPNEIALESA
jgi:hypothetical protein